MLKDLDSFEDFDVKDKKDYVWLRDYCHLEGQYMMTLLLGLVGLVIRGYIKIIWVKTWKNHIKLKDFENVESSPIHSDLKKSITDGKSKTNK